MLTPTKPAVRAATAEAGRCCPGSRRSLVGVILFVALATSVHASGGGPEARGPWGRMMKLHAGERIVVTTAPGEQAAVFVAADPSSLVIADLSGVPEERVRRAIPQAVREALDRLVVGALLRVKGVGIPIVRLEKEQVQRVTRLSERASRAGIAAAVTAAAIGGIYLGAYAAISVQGGLLSNDNPGTAALAFFGIAIGLPTAVGFGVHAATKHSYTEELYLAPVPAPLGEADWQAVQRALPSSLRQAAGEPSSPNSHPVSWR